MISAKNISADKMIPSYTHHVDESILMLREGRLMASFEVDGFPFEATSDAEISNLHNTLRSFFLSLCKTDKAMLWTHLVKKKDHVNNTIKIEGEGTRFLQKFYDKYIESLGGGNFFQTKYYLTIGIPTHNKSKVDIQSSIDKMNEIIAQVKSVLKRFKVRALSINSKECSEISSYLSYLVNHKEEDIPVYSSNNIKDTILESDIAFGFDGFQIQNFDEDNEVIYGANYIIKDFPRLTEIGHFDFLLKMPYEFVLTNSFIPETATQAIKNIDAQLNKLRSTKNYSEYFEAELTMGSQELQSGETMLGNFHSVLSVFGKSFEEAKENGIKVSSEFLSSGKGFRYSKATYESSEAYFSHLPLNSKRPLGTVRSINNFACLTSFHNFSYGKANGNPIGDGSAIMPMKTSSDSLYHFNTHYSELGKNMIGKKLAGHALILGASGTGKTTLEATASAFLQRFHPSMFVVDYNRSTQLFVKAFGGTYFSIREGVDTGINPFQLANSDDVHLMQFLKKWVKRCAVNNDGTPPTDAECALIDQAVESVMDLPSGVRRFGFLLQTISKNSPLGMRLSKWCGEGALSWAVDSPKNEFNPDNAKIVGFDTTVLLNSDGGNDHPACEVVLAVLFFYKERMQAKGTTMLTVIEEFWKPANFPLTQEMIKSALKAGRMKGEMVWLASQSPEDAINCQIFEAIVQQTPTKICLPNPEAGFKGYKAIGLTEKEFKALSALDRESRTMLIKQSGSSSFAKLDLHGFDEFLPILSGSQLGVGVADSVIKRVGNNPDDWIPVFLEELEIIEKEEREKTLMTS